MTWRRSYDVPPPPLDDNDPYSQANDPRYADVELAPLHRVPEGTFWTVCFPNGESDIKPDLAAGKTVLVAATVTPCVRWLSTLRAFPDEDIAGLKIPTGIPLYYELDENFQPVSPGVPGPRGC